MSRFITRSYKNKFDDIPFVHVHIIHIHFEYKWMLDPQNVEHFSNFTSVIYSFFVVDKFTSVLHVYFINFIF